MEQLVEQFKAGQPVAGQLIEQAIEATPYIEQLLQQDDEIVLRTLQEVVVKLPFYVGLVLHDTLFKLSQRDDQIGQLAEQALHDLAPM